MPHDTNGNLLQPGDKVVLKAAVKSIQQTEEYCNVEIVAEHDAKPVGAMQFYNVNASQLEKVE